MVTYIIDIIRHNQKKQKKRGKIDSVTAFCCFSNKFSPIFKKKNGRREEEKKEGTVEKKLMKTKNVDGIETFK